MPDVEYQGGTMFLVQSRSRPEIRHQVDTSEFRGWGGCGCEDFEFKRRPFLTKPIGDPERKEPGEWQQCAHIERAFKLLGVTVNAAIVNKQREQAMENATRRKS
jgi:hypothetical protein